MLSISGVVSVSLEVFGLWVSWHPHGACHELIQTERPQAAEAAKVAIKKRSKAKAGDTCSCWVDLELLVWESKNLLKKLQTPRFRSLKALQLCIRGFLTTSRTVAPVCVFSDGTRERSRRLGAHSSLDGK